ncbi:MAG: IS200/IS605 family transposase [Chloroflexi bacterium]|nr:IS200/IS605 family transposase [Chloroflexota bacterium]
MKPISEPKVSSPAPAPSPALPPEMVVGVGLQLPAESAPPGLARTPHGLYNLTYTIVWLPKLPKTRLIGDITVRLNEWIRNIALAYDWRVERLEVRADCIVLVAMCPPATAPERVVNILKRSTSERVFAEFPRPAADHPARDFWAPGYLLLGAGQTLTPQQVGDYIAYTRREQGLNR